MMLAKSVTRRDNFTRITRGTRTSAYGCQGFKYNVVGVEQNVEDKIILFLSHPLKPFLLPGKFCSTRYSLTGFGCIC